MAKVSKILKKRIPGKVSGKTVKAKAPAKVTKPDLKEEESCMLGFKATVGERQRLQRNADRFNKGNLSAWIRRAGTHYVPPIKKTREAA